MNRSVIVLNADYSYLNTIDWKDAVCLLFKGRAEIVEKSKVFIKTVLGEYVLPTIIRLLKQIRAMFGKRVPWSRHNVFIRDSYVCQYCGKDLKPREAQVDHVTPVSKGGKTNFENCVTSCHACNQKKADLSLWQARMHLKRQPYQPTIKEFFDMKMRQLGVDKRLEAVFSAV